MGVRECVQYATRLEISSEELVARHNVLRDMKRHEGASSGFALRRVRRGEDWVEGK